jgi:Amiloride-sensitive sodium channel
MNNSKDLAVIKVYFPKKDSVLYQMTVLYAWYDIISEYGGILSLCFGCSIISLVEIAFFLSVRFYQNLFNSSNFRKRFGQKPKPNIFNAGRVYKAKFEYLQ